MPYTYRKVDTGYDVYQKDTKEMIGHVDGDKESLDAYLSTLYTEDTKEMSMETIGRKLRVLLNEILNPENDTECDYSWFYIEETYPSFAIVSIEGGANYYKVYYNIDEMTGACVLGNIEEVQRSYTPVLMEASNIFTRIKEFFGKKKEQTGFRVYKEKDDFRWVMVTATAHRDKDREIISTKALEADMDRTDKEEGTDYGYLNYWHVPELQIGSCDFRMLHGRMLIESGVIPNEKVALALQKKAHKASIEFYHAPDEPDREGVYHNIIVSGRAVLPSGYEANPFTFASIKGAGMKSKEEKIKEFEKLVGEDAVADILSTAEATQKEADMIAEFKEEDKKPKDDEEEEKPETSDEKPEEEDEEKKPKDSKKESVEIQEMVSEMITATVKEQLTAFFEKFVTAQKEQNDSTVASLKESFSNEVKALSDKVTALESDVPEIAKGYLASQNKETVIEQDDELLEKQTKQTNVDPVYDLMKNLGIVKE